MADALTKMRKICSTLDDVTEGPHFGDIMFKVRKKPFASCGADHVIVALAPEHGDLLVANEPAIYSRYARAKNGIVIATGKLKNWGAVEDLVHESYRLVSEKLPPKRQQPPAKKPAAAKKQTKSKR